jgi:hypothetical protein
MKIAYYDKKELLDIIQCLSFKSNEKVVKRYLSRVNPEEYNTSKLKVLSTLSTFKLLEGQSDEQDGIVTYNENYLLADHEVYTFSYYEGNRIFQVTIKYPTGQFKKYSYILERAVDSLAY